MSPPDEIAAGLAAWREGGALDWLRGELRRMVDMPDCVLWYEAGVFARWLGAASLLDEIAEHVQPKLEHVVEAGLDQAVGAVRGYLTEAQARAEAELREAAAIRSASVP